MQKLRLGDVSAAARALRLHPERRWAWVIRRLLAEARAGAAHLTARGRPHPRYGDGTLMAAALRRAPAPAPTLEDARFRRALVAVLLAMDGPHPRAQDRQVGVVGSSSSRPGAISSPHSVQ